MPDPERDGVEQARHRGPGEHPQRAPGRAALHQEALEPPAGRGRQPPDRVGEGIPQEQGGGGDHEQELVLHHVGRERALGEAVQRREQRQGDGGEAALVGGEAPDRRQRGVSPAEPHPAGSVEEGPARAAPRPPRAAIASRRGRGRGSRTRRGAGAPRRSAGPAAARQSRNPSTLPTSAPRRSTKKLAGSPGTRYRRATAPSASSRTGSVSPVSWTKASAASADSS